MSWEVDNAKKCFTACDHAKEMAQHSIVLSNDVWTVIRAMLKKYSDVEWQMMLTGKVDKKGFCMCDGYYITKQKVTGGTVTNLDEVTKEMIAEKKIVCGIHSHVNMGVSPSKTDIDDSVMSLVDYHIIVNNRLETTGIRKAVLPCKGIIAHACEVLVEGLVDLDAVVIEGLERIEKSTYSYVSYNDKHDYPAHVKKHTYWKDDKEVAQGLMNYGGYGMHDMD